MTAGQALMPTEYSGVVTFIGAVTKRETSLRSESLQSTNLLFAGIEGESHGGLNRPACSRTLQQHPRETTLKNVRQLTVLSAEDLALIAAQMMSSGSGALEKLDPCWLGASLVISGIPNFSHLPPSSRLQVVSSGATIVGKHIIAKLKTGWGCFI
jgi:hypothetical protein